MVPPEPTPQTTASSRPPVCAQISGPVVVSCADPLRHVLVVLGVALADVGAGHAHLGAHPAQVEHLLLAHLVRDDEDEPVALLGGHEREPEPRVARGRLDERRSRPDRAALLARLDHRETDAILDRAAGVLALELDEQLTGAGIERLQPDERRVADEREDAPPGRVAGCPTAHAARTAARPRSRSRHRSSTCSSPTESRTTESPIPSLCRTSAGIEAWVMSAGCSARDSTPPRLSASVNSSRAPRNRRAC